MKRWTFSFLSSIALIAAFASIALVGCPSGGVGDPCIPEDEYKAAFQGFKLTEENIESRSFQCQTRICLVNHFQGRVSCPKGQPSPKNCTNDPACPSVTSLKDGSELEQECVQAGAIIKDCDPTPCGDAADDKNCAQPDGTNAICAGALCDPDGKFCHCQSGQCPTDYRCDENQNVCITQVCRVAGIGGQTSVETAKEHELQRCFVPGTEEPISAPVCSQCSPDSRREADPEDSNGPDSVYCSCRCGPAEGQTEENFNFCECPKGFVCKEIRKDVGLGDAQIAGKYCIKEGTEYVDETSANCGQVQGYWDSQCSGTKPSGATSE